MGSFENLKDKMKNSISKNDIEKVKKLIPLVYQEDLYEYLFEDIVKYACRIGNIEITKILFNEYGKDINEYDPNPLMTAVENKHAKIVKFILEKGLDLNSEDSIEAFIKAVWVGALDIVKLFMEKGVDPEGFGIYNDTPIMAACNTGHLNIVKYLWEKGADINMVNEDNRTPLIVAAGYGYKDIVEFLVDKGVDIFHEDDYYESSITLSAIDGYYEVLQFLIDRAGDKMGKDYFDEEFLSDDCLNAVNTKVNIETIEIVNKYGAKLSDLALISACRIGRRDIVEYILKKRPDIDQDEMKNYIGIAQNIETLQLFEENGVSLEHAIVEQAEDGHDEIVKYILDKKPDIDKNLLKKAYKQAKKEKYKELALFLKDKIKSME